MLRVFEKLEMSISNSIEFTRIGVLYSKLWLQEARVFKLFFSNFPTKIPVKPNMLLANRDTLVIDEFTLFLKDS